MTIIEAIRERRSIRSYNGQPLSAEMISRLCAAVDESFSPFGGHVTIRLKTFDLKGDLRPSTYGVIKGASDFFLLGIGSGEDSAMTAGFRFEQVVLKAWEMGLGTCWIAGTFKGTQFDRGETWPEGESLKIICPVGVADKPRVLEKVGRMVMGSNSRQPFSKLFFEDSFETPLNPGNKFGESLEMLRLAPSSTNSQPWRALVSGEKVHFYYKPKGDVSVVDCGIGICHFYEAERFEGHSSRFEKESAPLAAPDGWKYLVSYIREL